jgi:hypothetical protein
MGRDSHHRDGIYAVHNGVKDYCAMHNGLFAARNLDDKIFFVGRPNDPPSCKGGFSEAGHPHLGRGDPEAAMSALGEKLTSLCQKHPWRQGNMRA